MAKLQLTLDKQATPVDDIKPRQENQELTESLIELAQRLENDWKEELKRAKKENRQPKDLKYTLNGLPEDIKPKSVSTKIYALRADQKLPANVLPAMRTVKDEDGTVREQVYMKWVKNPPMVKAKGE